MRHILDVGRGMNPLLERILGFLNSAKIRATYAAVGEALGNVPAVAVGRMLGKRRPEASWVVSGETGEPRGYAPNQAHPDLRSRARVLRTGYELRRWMAGLERDTEAESRASCKREGQSPAMP